MAVASLSTCMAKGKHFGHQTGFFLGALSTFNLSRQRRDQLAAEGRDVGHHAAPDEMSLAKCGCVHPGRTGVLEVVFYGNGAGRLAAAYDPGGNRHVAPVADESQCF